MKVLTYPIGKNEAVLTAYIQTADETIARSEARPAVLVIAGGGYEFVSYAEREPVAMAYAAQGFQTFTLVYSVKEKSVFPVPQAEALEAIALMRRQAAQFCIDPERIAVVGFSAGGHVAAGAGVFWNDRRINPLADRTEGKPNALVLVYPCITAGEYAYPGINSVHGKGTEYPDCLSLENYVGPDTPPAFLCHSAEDTCVPAMNSLLFAGALAKSRVPYELRIYKEGGHGVSLATKAVSTPYLKTLDAQTQASVRASCARFSEWLERSVEFLNLVFYPVPANG